jgi:SAM-dependent methyltransferase
MSEIKKFWNARYKESDYAYGKAPNLFFKEVLDTYKLAGSMLLPAEGEGRNAVYAASKNLDVTAFDISEDGQKKAEKLARENHVKIDYQVGDFYELPLVNQQYDNAALIYAHFPPSIRSAYYKKVNELLKPGGMLILEGFSKNHLQYQISNPNIGGPKDEPFLLSLEEIKSDFGNFEIIKLVEEEVSLNEGKYHVGTGAVIRFIGMKK